MLTFAVLDRIEQRLKALDMTPRAASLAAGQSPDLIRNWQRARAEGRPFSGKLNSIAALAPVLAVTPEWLIGDAPLSILADQATPYTPRPVNPGTALDAHLAPETPHRCTFKCGRAAPWLGVLAGDLLVIDMRTPPLAGDTVVANVVTGNRAETRILRYLPPHLTSGDPSEAPICEDDARIQGAVVALARGPGL
jgi:hypothetical protein